MLDANCPHVRAYIQSSFAVELLHVYFTNARNLASRNNLAPHGVKAEGCLHPITHKSALLSLY